MPPHIALARAWRKWTGEWNEKRRRQRDFSRPSYLLDLTSVPLQSHLSGLALPDLPLEAVREQSRQVLGHRFHLLGSGLVEVFHGMECKGLEGNRYPKEQSVTAD